MTAAATGIPASSVFISTAVQARIRARRAGGWFLDLLESFGDGYVWVFVTLTYRKIGEYRPRQVSDYIDKLREWLETRGAQIGPYLWAGEYQKRGALHYHLVCRLPRGFRKIPKPDESGMWALGSSNVQAITGLEGAQQAAGYVLKYVIKAAGQQGAFARVIGARHYGIGGLSPEQKESKRWACAPGRVQSASEGEPVRRRGSAWQRWDGNGKGWQDVPATATAMPCFHEGVRGVMFTEQPESGGDVPSKRLNVCTQELRRVRWSQLEADYRATHVPAGTWVLGADGEPELMSEDLGSGGVDWVAWRKRCRFADDREAVDFYRRREFGWAQPLVSLSRWETNCINEGMLVS